MHYTGTHTECESYNNQVTAGEGYKDSTTNWAEPRKHPAKELWAIIAHEKYESEMDTLEELSKDWFPDQEIN